MIRHTDPATYQEFQNQLSAMSAAAAASGPSSAPGPSKADVVKVILAQCTQLSKFPFERLYESRAGHPRHVNHATV